MLPGRQELVVGIEQGDLSDSQCHETETHEDGTDHADEEGDIVPPADTLVEPLTVVVKHMYTFVTHRAMLGSDCSDADIAQVTSKIEM